MQAISITIINFVQIWPTINTTTNVNDIAAGGTVFIVACFWPIGNSRTMEKKQRKPRKSQNPNP